MQTISEAVPRKLQSRVTWEHSFDIYGSLRLLEVL